jgi:hypothetical protein
MNEVSAWEFPAFRPFSRIPAIKALQNAIALLRPPAFQKIMRYMILSLGFL